MELVPQVCGSSMKPEGSDREDGDERVEIDLNDKPGSLLNFLNARRRRVAKSVYGCYLGLPVS